MPKDNVRLLVSNLFYYDSSALPGAVAIVEPRSFEG